MYPLMTLLFGNLTNAFVKFGKAVQALAVSGPTPEALATLDVAAGEFRKEASHDHSLTCQLLLRADDPWWPKVCSIEPLA
jgi:hypothetical protein